MYHSLASFAIDMSRRRYNSAGVTDEHLPELPRLVVQAGTPPQESIMHAGTVKLPLLQSLNLDSLVQGSKQIAEMVGSSTELQLVTALTLELRCNFRSIFCRCPFAQEQNAAVRRIKTHLIERRTDATHRSRRPVARGRRDDTAFHYERVIGVIYLQCQWRNKDCSEY